MMNLKDNTLIDDDDVELQEYINYQRSPYIIIQCRVDNFKQYGYDFKVHSHRSKKTVMEVLNLIQHFIFNSNIIKDELIRDY